MCRFLDLSNEVRPLPRLAAAPFSSADTTASGESVACLRPACSRGQTYLWMVLVLMGLSIRQDRAGVTSLVRVLGLAPPLYKRLLALFDSSALDLDRLTELWASWCSRTLPAMRVGRYCVCLADGLKVTKEGRKMPAVKKLRQASANNSKPPFIFGHSFQAISLLVRSSGGYAAAIPLAARIHEGVVWSNRDRRSLLDKLVLLFMPLAATLQTPVILVAGAYYASRKVIIPLLAAGHQLVTRVRKNTVAYQIVPAVGHRRHGRPRIYGKRLRVSELLGELDTYHRHVQLGCIAQGLLQDLAIYSSAIVWKLFRAWVMRAV